MERTKEQVAPSVAALTLDLDACLAAVAERTRIDEEERLQKEAARLSERRLVEDAATVVAGLVLARLPAALREPGGFVAVDVSDVFGDMEAERAPRVRERAAVLLEKYFEAVATWTYDTCWRFSTLRGYLKTAFEQLDRKRAAKAPEAPTDSAEQAQPEVTFAPSCDDENGGKTPQERYQRAVAMLRERHEELRDRQRESALYDHEEEMRDNAQVHLAEVLGEGIPGLIDLRDVRFCSGVPCDVLRAEGDIIDENGAALLLKGECFAVERGAAAEGDLARVKLQWWDESGTYRNEFALAMQPAAIVGECRDANLKDVCAAGRLK